MDFHLKTAGSCKGREFLFLPKTGSYSLVDLPSIFGVFKHPQHGVILIDTGYERVEYDRVTLAGFPGRVYRKLLPVDCEKPDSALSQLEAMGIKADEVTFIVITHFHADHICGLRSFPKAKYVVPEAAYKHLRSMSKFQADRHAFFPSLLPDDFEARMITLPSVGDAVLTLPSAQFRDLSGEYQGMFGRSWDLFGDQSVVVVPLDGHCAGHVGALITYSPLETAKKILMVGDACWSIRNLDNCEQPHWLSFLIVHHDGKRYRKTLRELSGLQATMKDKLKIVPAHCILALKQEQQ